MLQSRPSEYKDDRQLTAGYRLLGPQCTSKSAEFATALHMAQDMAVLTPSMQDRALLPSCEVVFGAAPPRDVRAAFRKFVVPDRQREDQRTVFEVAEMLGALD